MEMPQVSLPEQLELYRVARRRRDLVQQAARLLLMAGSGLLLFCAFDYWLQPSWVVRFALAAVWYTAVGIKAVRLLRRYAIRASDLDMAWELEARLPLGECLISAVEFYQSPQLGTSPEMLDWTQLDAQVELSQATPEELFPVQRAWPVCGGILIAILLIGCLLLPDGIGRSARRLLVPTPHDATAGSFSLGIISPGTGNVLEGKTVAVRMHCEESSLTNVYLVADNEYAQHRIRAELEPTTGHYLAELRAVREDTLYWAAAGRVRSRAYQLTVLAKPRLRALNYRIVPPDYLDAAIVEGEDLNGQIEGLIGATVELNIELSSPITWLQIKRGTETIRAIIDGSRASLRFHLRRTEHFTIEYADDSSGHAGQFSGLIRGVEDEPPWVQFLTPAGDIYCEPGDTVPLSWRDWDDHGLESVALQISKNGEPLPDRVQDLSASTAQLELDRLGARSGDRIDLRLLVRDKAGRQATSKTRSLHVSRATFLRDLPAFESLMTQLAKSATTLHEQLKALKTSTDLMRSMSVSVGDEAHHRYTAATLRESVENELSTALDRIAAGKRMHLFPGSRLGLAQLDAALSDIYLFSLAGSTTALNSDHLQQAIDSVALISPVLSDLRERLQQHKRLWTRDTLYRRLQQDPSPQLLILAAAELASKAKPAEIMPQLAAAIAESAAALAKIGSLLRSCEALAQSHPLPGARFKALASPELTDAERLQLLGQVIRRLKSRTFPDAEEDTTRYLVIRALEDAASHQRIGSIELLARTVHLLQSGIDAHALRTDWEQRHHNHLDEQLYALQILHHAPLQSQPLSKVPAAERLTSEIRIALKRRNPEYKKLAPAFHALMRETETAVARARTQLAQYSEPASQSLRFAADQLLAALAGLEQDRADVVDLHAILLAETVAELERLARDEIRAAEGSILAAADATVLARVTAGHVEELREQGNSADILEAVADALTQLAEFAELFEAALAGEIKPAEAVANSAALQQAYALLRPEELSVLAPLRRERRGLDALRDADQSDFADDLQRRGARLASLLGSKGSRELRSRVELGLATAQKAVLSWLLESAQHGHVPAPLDRELARACHDVTALLHAFAVFSDVELGLRAELALADGEDEVFQLLEALSDVLDALPARKLEPVAYASSPPDEDALWAALAFNDRETVLAILAGQPTQIAEFATLGLRHGQMAGVTIDELDVRQGPHGFLSELPLVPTPGVPLVDLQLPSLQRLAIAREAATGGNVIQLQTSLARNDWRRISRMSLGSSAAYLDFGAKLWQVATEAGRTAVQVIPAEEDAEFAQAQAPSMLNRWEFLALCIAEQFDLPQAVQAVRYGEPERAIAAFAEFAKLRPSTAELSLLAGRLLCVPVPWRGPPEGSVEAWLMATMWDRDPVQQLLRWEVLEALATGHDDRARVHLLAYDRLETHPQTHVLLATLPPPALRPERRPEVGLAEHTWAPGCPWQPHQALLSGETELVDAIVQLWRAAYYAQLPESAAYLRLPDQDQLLGQARDLLGIAEQRFVMHAFDAARPLMLAPTGATDGFTDPFQSATTGPDQDDSLFHSFERANSAAAFSLHFRRANRRYLERLTHLLD